MTCIYCSHPIDQSTLDWGITFVDYGVRYWYEECFSIYEPTAVLEEL